MTILGCSWYEALPLIATGNTFSQGRRIAVALLLLSLALTAWLWMHEAQVVMNGAAHQNIVFNPGYQHSQRLQVATARAAMDVLGMNGTTGANSSNAYQADYRLQRMQIQADSEGLDRWAAHDLHHQGMLLEIRASLAGLRIALDQMTGSPAASSGISPIPLLPALSRTQSALSNYSASLSQPVNPQTKNYLLSSAVQLWWLLILTLSEIAILAWVIFSTAAPVKTSAI